MGKRILIILLLLNYFVSYAQQKDTTTKQEPFTWVNEMPKFPGGDAALYTYIQKNINYPREARENNIIGRITVRFVVDETGKVRDAQVPKGMGIGGGCNEEAIRVVMSLPSFEPGKQNGHPVPVWYAIPVIFSLGGDLADGSFYNQSLRFLEFHPEKIIFSDKTYKYDSSYASTFFVVNSKTLLNFRKSVRDLDFDHCNHQLDVLLYLDTNGKIPIRQLITSIGLPHVDSTIIARFDSLEGKLIPILNSDRKVKSIIPLRLKYFDATWEADIDQGKAIGPKYTYYWNTNKPVKNDTKCENDSYFYNEGVRYYKAGDYSNAIYNFKQALTQNERDYDALFNLGLCYVKLEKLKNACVCFSQGSKSGDPSAIKAVETYCSESVLKK